MASGGLVGGIVSGFGLKLIAQPLGTENLIFLYAALQGLTLLQVRSIVSRLRDPGGMLSEKKAGNRATGSKAGPIRPTANLKGETLFGAVPQRLLEKAILIDCTNETGMFKRGCPMAEMPYQGSPLFYHLADT